MTRKVLQLVAVFGMGVTAAFAAQGQQYSADMVTYSGGETYSGRVFVNDDKMRYELPQAITITRLDRQTSYVLMPEEKMYMEQAVDPSMAAKVDAARTQGEFERVSEGQEEVGGRMTEKFKITYTDANGPMVVYQWEDSEGLPARVESVDGSWRVEYRNAQRGEQPEDLFEIPPGYQKFAIPVFPNMELGASQGAGGTPPDIQALLQQAQQEAGLGGDGTTEQ